MIRLILAAAVVGGLLQHLFGQMPAPRKGSARRTRQRVSRARPKRSRAASVSR